MLLRSRLQTAAGRLLGGTRLAQQSACVCQRSTTRTVPFYEQTVKVDVATVGLANQARLHGAGDPHVQPRGFATTAVHRLSSDGTTPKTDVLSDKEYHHLADELLEGLVEKLEAYLEALDLPDTDIDHASGVATLKLGKLGTFVVNKQAPNKQIWLSSPVSGPTRYDYVGGQWVYLRDGHELLGRLEEELKQLCGADLHLRDPETPWAT